MSDRRLQEAFARDAAYQAMGLVTRAVSKLAAVSRAAGEQRFDSVIPELEQVRQRIKEVAEECMTEDITKDFFKCGLVYTDRKPGWEPTVPAVEFEAVMVTRNPSTGERVAFGWRSWSPDQDGKKYPDFMGEQVFARFTVKQSD